MKLKKSQIVGGIVALAIVVATALVIFWPKSVTEPAASEEETSEAGSELLPEVDADNVGTAPLSKPVVDVKLPPSSDPKMKKVEDIIIHSRVLDQFKAMDDLLEAQLEQIQDAAQLSSADQEELARLKQIVSSKNLLANYQKLMYERMDEKELDHLKEVYQNPNISRVKDAQVYNQTQEGQKELMDFHRTFKADSLSPGKLAALKELDKQSGGTKNTVDMIKRVGEMTGNASKDPKHAKENAEFEKTIYAAVEQANLTSNAKMMAQLSDEEIRETARTISDPVYQKASAIEQEVANSALTQVGEITAAKLKQDSKKKD